MLGAFLYNPFFARRARARAGRNRRTGRTLIERSLIGKGGRKLRQITGNKLLVRALKEEGVDTVFGYPGACTIDISDELYKQDDIRVILPRHEQALVHEADAYARTTGKAGVCLVTSGPGATNLVTGLATANYDSVPLVCFTGQVAKHLRWILWGSHAASQSTA